MMADETSETRNNARLRILELANMISVPMALNAIVRLNVPDAIWQGGSNTPISASQILKRLQQQPKPKPKPKQEEEQEERPGGGGGGGADPENLQRILRMLTTYEVFSEHIVIEPNQQHQQISRLYSLTEIGKTLVTDQDGLSYASYVIQHHQDALVKAWPLLHEAVLDPTVEPFVKANGEPAYGFYGDNPEMNELMQKAMSGVSAPFMKAILDGYDDGFRGIQRLVDVGGSAGDCLKMIMKKFPEITQGINFDLPQVVSKAPNISGVKHIGGDMFKSIPDGDAIFMKWVLTTWTDDECQAIMKNCFNALPQGGKLIACEPVLPHESDTSHRTRALLEGDIFVMTIYRAKGKHRTEDEFRQLGLSSGFPHFRAIYIDHFYTLLEFQK